MLAGFQRQLRQSVMGIWGCGDNHQLHIGILNEFFGRPVRCGSRMIDRGIIPGFGAALDNRLERELRSSLNERNMEDFGTETVANHANAPGICHFVNDENGKF